MTPIHTPIVLGASCPCSGAPGGSGSLNTNHPASPVFFLLLFMFLSIYSLCPNSTDLFFTLAFLAYKNSFSHLKKKFQNNTEVSQLGRHSLNPFPQVPFLMYSWLAVKMFHSEYFNINTFLKLNHVFSKYFCNFICYV